MNSLIIVESPIKTDKITKILNSLNFKNFKVIGTGGHVTELYKANTAITLKNGKFTGDFRVLSNKRRILNQISFYAKRKDTITYVCMDDDREGEKIANDIVILCKLKKYYRVVFTEITKNAINKAIVQRTGIRLVDEQVVLAQWARRMIDRIIGYGLSPLISYYFKKNNILSYKRNGKEETVKAKGIGRVIAISLSLLAKRQEEIDKYNETGAITTDVVVANYVYEGIPFTARGDGLEFKKERITEMNHAINTATRKIHRVYERTREIEEIAPYPAFSTTSLYSACSYIYGMASSQTKKITQELYENGIINYPRTDSINLSDEASEKIIQYLLNTLKEDEIEDILKTKRVYKKRNQYAQEAHEAIRPTNFTEDYSPKNIKAKIWNNSPEYKNFTNFHYIVYSLIWSRAVSTQLKNSEYDRSKLTIKAGDYIFTARANERYKDGWEKYYGEALRDTNKGDEKSDWKSKIVILPPNLAKGTILEDIKIESFEKTSRSPKRISEGALISMLTNLGVARPSTLHTIVPSLVNKKYVESAKTLLSPTDLGMEIYKITKTHLNWLNDIKKAREFEKMIKSIETGDITDVDAELMKYWNLVEEFKKVVFSKNKNIATKDKP